MDNRLVVSAISLGGERQPLAILDGFSDDPAALRRYAATQPFETAHNHYPGRRAPLPESYWSGRGRLLAKVIAETFGLVGTIRLIDASFSIVTTPRTALTVHQRLPHCDALAANRIALIHYLVPDGTDGTAFFRHRSTGFETVDDARRPVYFGQLEAELRIGGLPPADYISGDTALFERTTLVEGRYDRALLYRSNQLHSGAIAPGAELAANPASGRLTVTAFLSVD